MRRLLPLPLLLAIAVVAVAVIRLESPNRAGASGPDTWTAVAAPAASRAMQQSATLLDGRVFVVGGSPLGGSQTAEVYDPASDTWSAAGSVPDDPFVYGATTLSSGKVLVTGTLIVGGDISSTPAHIYDPGSNTWSPAGSLTTARVDYMSALLASGKVLVAGGYPKAGDPDPLPTELYDPSTNSWASVAATHGPHHRSTATLLANGKVYIPPEPDYPTVTAQPSEIFDAGTNTWSLAKSFGGRWYNTATLLPNGKVLIAGGTTFVSGGSVYVDGKIYDPVSDEDSWTGPMTPLRTGHTATLLNSGLVLVAGGNTALDNAMVYNPSTNTWNTGAHMNVGRDHHIAARLANGNVLVAGPDLSAEIYEPGSGPPVTDTPTATWTSTPTPIGGPATSTPTPTTAPPTATPTPGLPDLVINFMSITLVGGSACDFTSTTLGIRIYFSNQGSSSAGAFNVNVNGVSQTVAGGLAAGSGSDLWFAGYGGGNQTATVDSTFAVAESNESNNTLNQFVPIPTLPPTCTPTGTPTLATPPPTTATVTPTATATPALPDLVVLTISDQQQGAPGCNTPAGLRIVVRNQKPGGAGASTLLVSALGNGQTQSIPVPAIPGSSTITVYSSVVGLPGGDTFTAIADSGGVVVETNEVNNSTSATLALTATATCTPSPTPGANTPTVTPTPTGFSTQDTDGDGWPGYADNCPFIYNPGQFNSDRNFISNHPVYIVDDRTLINSDLSGDVCDYDWDNDGLADGAEVTGPPCASAAGPTNPESLDTDHDGAADGYECAHGFDPVDPVSKPPPPAPGTDPDGDRLSTDEETGLGTNPNNPDSDGDGLQDGWEVRGYGSSPLVIDSDGDGARDGCEAASLNLDTLVNPGDQAMMAAEILRAVPPSQKLANFDLNKDGVLNPGDQAFQASRTLPGRCPLITPWP